MCGVREVLQVIQVVFNAPVEASDCAVEARGGRGIVRWRVPKVISTTRVKRMSVLAVMEPDIVPADASLGFSAVISSQFSNEFLVLWRSLVGAGMGSSGAISQAPLALLGEPLNQLEDCGARGAEGPGDFRDVFSVGEEEIDHWPAVALGLPRVSRLVVTGLSSHHVLTPELDTGSVQ
jgi:hypothetical protein